MNIGLTMFDIHYFDVDNDSIRGARRNPATIHQLEIDVRLESTVPYDETYSYVAWRHLRLRSRNIEGR